MEAPLQQPAAHHAGQSLLIIAPPSAERTLLHGLAESVGLVRIEMIENAIEAYGRLALWRPTLTLVDAQLKPTDGLTFIREVRATPILNADAPMCLLTREDPALIRFTAEHAGADGVLKLPVSQEDLQDALARRERAQKDEPAPDAPYRGEDRRLADPIPFVGADRRRGSKPLSAATARVHGLIESLLQEADAGIAAWAHSGLDPNLVSVESALDRAAQLAVKIGDAALLSALTKTLAAIDASRRTWNGDDRAMSAAVDAARKLLVPAETSTNPKL